MYGYVAVAATGVYAPVNYFHMGSFTYAKFRTAMLLLLGLICGTNSTLLVSSVNTLLTY